MFKKKPQFKPLAPLRSSDRRRTADQIISDLGLEESPSQDEHPEAKEAALAKHTSLRNSLLPENVQSARFTTTHGPEQHKVSGTVFIAAHPGDEQRVLWVNIEGRLYPTVYTLWKNPRILPLLHTPANVVTKMRSGADLMTPGLAGPPFPARAKKGSLVAVASLEKPSVPMVVGICEVDISSLEIVEGTKGHAVQTAHWCGDELWAWSANGKPGGQAPEELEGWLDASQEESHFADRLGDLDLGEDGDHEGGVALNQPTSETARSRYNDHVEGEELDPSNHAAKMQTQGLNTQEIDNAFYNAFLFGIHHHKESNKGQPNFGLEFPLSQSFVMSTLVQPFLPAHTPEQAAALQIKKTSWKNIKKFMKHMDKRKIVKTKDRDGNEVVIQDIDFDDREILDFKPYPLPRKLTAAGTSLGRGEKATSEIDAGDESIGQAIHVITLNRPKEKLAPIFAQENSGTSNLYATADIRPLVTNYVEAEGLVSPNNKRLIKLNPFLANSVFDGSFPLDSEVIAKGTVPRDALVDRVISLCSPHFAILRNNQDLSMVKPRAGSAPKVKITMETRGGNKTVTKISGVESFFIPPQPLAEELKKLCAGSASVEKLIGSSPKEERKEILVQGPQKDATIKALERRGVKSQWVEVLDKTKGKKR
ncbi:MAG: hypothetical protein M1820_005723 [Bogoriella megaspora]|nr:MAG: hypothetical protein M1820_005723 [Bogoriella megaspora]